jgi:cellulose synthase/poly-beta-1,6-N-acetylglucosamine synthase-like glycosyltransferase
LVVTRKCEYSILEEFSRTINAKNFKVLMVPVADKRLQLCRAIPEVETDIVVFADGDVTWPSTILPWLLAPFENPKIGGVGTSQRARLLKTGPLFNRCINWLGRAYIQRRNFEITATHGIDGGTSCMSGRTHAVRTRSVKDDEFLSGFQGEKWGENRLQADDDNFVTRWLIAKGWETWVQYNPECEIETTLENDIGFIDQIDRWARSNWRCNLTRLATGLWK